MNFVNVGSYLCNNNVLMESNLAKTLIKYLDDLFTISKLKNGYYDWGCSWEYKLNKEEISLEFYEGSKYYDKHLNGKDYVEVDGVNLLGELDFYINKQGICDTIRLYACGKELSNFGINSEKDENRIFEKVDINNEQDLKIALDFLMKKI